MKSFTLLLAGLLAITVCQPTDAQTRPKVEVPGTEQLTLTSSIVAGQEYRLDINLPVNYARDTAKTYPVLYLLDGQYDFPLFAGLYSDQYYDGFLPGIITVGITWGGKDPDAGTLRGRDFTPTHMANMPQSGNRPKFLEFIKKELIPFIKSKYRVNDDRTLTGSSLGGLFTLYTLYNDPSLFHRYILTSPSLWWDNGILSTWEAKYEATGSSTPVRVFMGQGELEGDDAEFLHLADRLKKVKNMEVHTLVLEDTGHAGTKPEGYSRGLQWAFEKPSLTLPAAVLERYVGTYQAGKDTVHLAAKDGHLVVLPPANVVLLAETEQDFYLNGAFVKVHFKEDDAGVVTGFRLEQFDGEVFFKRVK